MQGTRQMPTEQQISKKKMHWIGHTLHKTYGATERHALDWNIKGKRERGRQREHHYISTKAHKFV